MDSPYCPSSDGVSSPGAQSCTTDVCADSDRPRLSSALTSVPLVISKGTKNSLHPNTVADIVSKVKPLVLPIRQRTPRACDKCRERKTKCSGHQPVCNRCTSRGLSCVYSHREQGARRSSRRLPSPLPEPPHLREKPPYLQSLRGNLGVGRPTPAARSTMGIGHISAFVSEPLAPDVPDFGDFGMESCPLPVESVQLPFPEEQVLHRYQLPSAPLHFPNRSWGTALELDTTTQSDLCLGGYSMPIDELPLQVEPRDYTSSSHSPYPQEAFVEDEAFVYLCDFEPSEPFSIIDENVHEFASNYPQDAIAISHSHALPHPSSFRTEDLSFHAASSSIPPENYNVEDMYLGSHFPVYTEGYYC